MIFFQRSILLESQTCVSIVSHHAQGSRLQIDCQVTNCGKNHHSPSLHRANQGSASTSTKPCHSNHKNTPIQKTTSSDTKFNENKDQEFESKTAIDESTRFKHQAAIQLQTVPIRVQDEQGFVDSYAFLDTCCTASKY